jgi:hypothetical protein
MKKFSSGMTERNPVLDTDELLIKPAGESGPEFCTVEKLFEGRAGLSLGEGATDAYYGDKGKIAYDHSQRPHAAINCLETTVRIYQEGTNAPNIQWTFIDEIKVENPLDPYSPKRWVSFGRDGVGTYYVRINYTYESPETVNGNHVAVSLSDRKCEVYTMANGGVLNDHYDEWGFKSYTPAGVLADSIITWMNVTLRYFPES